MEAKSSAQSLFKKLDFGNSNQKPHKNQYQTFLSLSSTTGSLYPVRNTLSEIVGVEISAGIVCLDLAILSVSQLNETLVLKWITVHVHRDVWIQTSRFFSKLGIS